VSNTNKLKIFNDPIYGFITIPNTLIYDLIQHPYFQRLRRITQMGLSYLVYPGAHHTRFHHAIGAMHIMQKAVEVLRFILGMDRFHIRWNTVLLKSIMKIFHYCSWRN